VLDVAYNPLLEENPALQKNLMEEGLNFAVANVDKINFEPLQTLPPIIATHILQALQRKIGKNWALVTAAPGNDKPLRLDDIKGSTGGNWAKISPRKTTELKRQESAAQDAAAKSGSKSSLPTSGSKGSMPPVDKSSKKDEKKKEETAKKEEKAKETAKTEEGKIARSKSKKEEDGKKTDGKK